MIKNIIFDIGNVLLTFEPKKFLLKFTQDNKHINSFISNVIDSEVWLQMDRGSISVEEAKNLFLSKYPEEKKLLTLFFENWLEIFIPIKENIQIMEKLNQNGYKIFALSNFIKESFKYVVKKFSFFALFDGQVISWQEKVIKPEDAIYNILLHRYNLIPQECVYLDDHKNFLEPAQKLGMSTILVSPEIDLKKEFQKLGVNI